MVGIHDSETAHVLISIMVATYLPPDTGLQSQTACCPSSESQRWSSSLQSQDELLLLLYFAGWEKPETSQVGLQQLPAGLIVFSGYVKTTAGAGAPGQTSPLQLQG